VLSSHRGKFFGGNEGLRAMLLNFPIVGRTQTHLRVAFSG